MSKRNMGGVVGAICLMGVVVPSSEAASNTTIYGYFDVAIAHASGQPTKMDRGYNNWLGFKGEETIDEDLSAVINAQTRFKLDTGELERAHTMWQGESTVGLNSRTMGNLRVGRAVTPMWNNVWLFEPWYNSGFNASLQAFQTGSYSSSPLTDVALEYANYARISNGVFYDSPEHNGWRVALAAEIERQPKAATRTTGLSVNYSRNGLGGMLSYERNAVKDELWFAGGSYRLGPVVLMGSLARTERVAQPIERMVVLATTIDVGADKVMAGYGYQSDEHRQKLSLGYSYTLSPRTNLYADIYRDRGNVGIKGYALGMIHSF